MNNEEKARAFDEALKKAREIIKGEGEWSMSDMYEIEPAIMEIFPQLRESEDERIRENLVALVEAFGQGKYKNEMLSYLEKQKEQKPVRAAKEVWKEMRHEVYAQASGNRHEPNYSDDSTKMFSLCDIDEIFEKIGNSIVESQPAEWSEFDKGALKDAICAADILGNDESFNKGNPYLAKAFRVAKDWLKSLPERFNLQPKQEWSEEDEEKINIISEIIEHCITIPYSVGTLTLSKEYKTELQDFIKSLRPQSEQEWDEFDEGCLKRAIWYVENPAPNVVKDTNLVLWLKSLRPQSHWKPSEEQMDALRDIIETVPMTCRQQGSLESLESDIKKL